MNDVLWSPGPNRIEKSRIFDFMQDIAPRNYPSLHEWSVKEPQKFWSKVMDYFAIVREGDDQPACTDLSFKSYGWFPNVRLNFAENLLRHREGVRADRIALNCLHEKAEKRRLSYRQLAASTGRLANYLKDHGFKEGDVLGAWMPNLPETVVAMLASTSLGGVFTSTSCDFGVEGVVDRFGQSRPKVLIAAAGYSYNGKDIDLMPRLLEISKKLPGIEKIIVVDFLNTKPDVQTIERAQLWDDALASSGSDELTFKRMPFSAPLYIMYSSGTTGKPKCIVHSIGGTLLQHVKELGLHCDLNEKKNILFFTTCGWMMWNWMITSLAFGAEVTLYEGSPAYPDLKSFVELVGNEKVHIFGTSPKFLKALEDAKVSVETEFPVLETILSTGAPLMPEQFDFVYRFFKHDLHLASISGGTDIIGCFMLGNPLLPVRRGEIQAPGLGMDIACYNEKGEPQAPGVEGELVCLQSFPSRPIYFLDDPQDEKLNDAYFNHFPNVWYHGDYIHMTAEQGIVVHGRSDATLNPGGVRIGTAEIYRQTESLPWIEDAICVGRPHAGDVEVLLFLKLKQGEKLTADKVDQVRALIRKETSPRHVPAKIYQVSDIPYTRSGKKMELAVTRLLAHKPLTNIEAVANPECLEQYKKIAD